MVRSMFTAKPTFDLVCVCVCAGQLGELGPVSSKVPDQAEVSSSVTVSPPACPVCTGCGPRTCHGL